MCQNVILSALFIANFIKTVYTDHCMGKRQMKRLLRCTIAEKRAGRKGATEEKGTTNEKEKNSIKYLREVCCLLLLRSF